MRIRDWSSDVCSSDLVARDARSDLLGTTHHVHAFGLGWVQLAVTPAIGGDRIARNLGTNESRAHQREADTVAPQLGARRFKKTMQRMLGGGVNGAQRRTHLADPAAANDQIGSAPCREKVVL